jgi:2-oxoglutarate ferredoxin oxidoreductase subunit delta
MRQKMNEVKVNDKLCKGCGYCVHYCPKKILELGKVRSSKGHFYPAVTDQDACIACLMCATICPEGAIEVAKGE